MPTNTGTVKIEIRVDDKGTVKVKKFGDQSEKAFKRTGKSVGDFNRKLTTSNASLMKMQSILVGLLGTYGLYKLASALNDCVKAASDLEEVTSKFNVVFAEQAKKAEEWARVLQDSYAMSMREAKQYLSSIQDLLVPMGMNARAAAYLSNEIVKLSADLGSFNNLPTAQVMLDIQSALVGNYETMKKYGIVVNATITQEKALVMGLATTKDELTVAQKAFAAYTLILEGSKAAIGDMARTSNSYANQIKAMKANVEDLRAEIGTNLLPALASWLKSINAILKAWNKLFEGPSSLDLLTKKAQKLRKQIEGIELQLRAVKRFGWGDTRGISAEKLNKELEKLRKQLELIEKTIKRTEFEVVAKVAADYVSDIRGGIEDINALLNETANQADKVEKKFRDMWQDWAQTDEWVEKSKKAVTEFEVWKAEEKKKEVKKTEKAVNEMEEIYKNFLRNVQSNFADTFYDIFSGQLNSFDDFLDSMKKSFLRMLAEMAAAAAMKKIVIPMATSMGSASGLFGAAQGAGTGTQMPSWVSTLGSYGMAAYAGWTIGQTIGKMLGLGPKGENAYYRFGSEDFFRATYGSGEGFEATTKLTHHGGGKEITNAIRELYEQMVNQANSLLKSVPMKLQDQLEPYLESIVFKPTDYKFKFKNAEQVIQAMAEKWTAQVEEAFNKAARAAGNASFAEMLAWEDIAWQASVMSGAVSDLEVQIHNINEQFDAWIQQLTQLGSSEERLAQIEKYRQMALDGLTTSTANYARQIEGLQATLLSITTGSDSPLDAMERLALAKKAIGSAMGPDMTPEDINKIQGLWTNYLRIAQEAYQRPSLEYQNIYAETTAALNSLVGWLQGMESYQHGTDYVPVTGPAILHRGERVSRPGDGASVVVNFQPTIRVDGSRDSMRASREITGEFERFIRGRGRKIVQEAVKYQ